MCSKRLLVIFLLCLFTFKKAVFLKIPHSEYNVKSSSQNQQLETEMTNSNSDSSDDSVDDQTVNSKLHLYGSTVPTKYKQSNPSSKEGNGRGVSQVNSMVPKTDDEFKATIYRKQDKISYKSTSKEANKPTTSKVHLKGRIPEDQEKYKNIASENTEDNTNNPIHEEGGDTINADNTITAKPKSRITSRPRYEDRFKEKTTSSRKVKYPKLSETDDNTSSRMISLTSQGNEQFSSMNPTRRPTSLTILTRSPLNSKPSLKDDKSTVAFKSNERNNMPTKPESYITTPYKQNERSKYTTTKPLVTGITVEDEDADADNNKAVTYKMHNVQVKSTQGIIPTIDDLNDCTTLIQDTTPIYKIQEETKDNYKEIESKGIYGKNKLGNDNDKTIYEEDYKLDKSDIDNYSDEDKESEDRIKGDYRKIIPVPNFHNPPENNDEINQKFSTKAHKYSQNDPSNDPDVMELSNKFDQNDDDLELKDKTQPYGKPFRNEFLNDNYNNHKSRSKEEFSKPDTYKNEDRIGRHIDEPVNDQSHDYYFSPANEIKEIQKFYSYPKQDLIEKQYPESYHIDLQPFQVKKEYHVPNYRDSTKISVTPKYATYMPYTFRNSQPMYEYRQVHQ